MPCDRPTAPLDSLLITVSCCMFSRVLSGSSGLFSPEGSKTGIQFQSVEFIANHSQRVHFKIVVTEQNLAVGMLRLAV